MGFDTFPIENQGAQGDLTLLDGKNAAVPSSMLERLGQKRARRSSVRMRNNFTVDAKKDGGYFRKPAAKMPPLSTRGQNGVTSTDNSSRDMEQDEHDSVLAETCAVALASLDRRACARAQMQEANTILEQLVLPISFPWSQSKEILYKPLPRDIDEMSIIMHCDEDCSVMELNSETFRTLSAADIPKNITISASRTDDPGVLELRTYTQPSASRLRRFKRTGSARVPERRHENSIAYGEHSLQMYHEVQLKKRRREDFDDMHTAKKLVSFRVGCTSSRSTIFSPSELSNNPLFLQALHPKYIQDGVNKFGLEAYEEGIMHGSYNGRQLPSRDSVINDPSSKNRFIVGRTRLVWSEKEQTKAKSIRPSYCSILTRQRLEGSTSKRPLSVKVGIRINGVLVSERQSQETALNVVTAVLPESTYSHSVKSVNDALDLACSIEEKQIKVLNQSNEVYAPRDYSQCTLNLPKYVTEVAKDEQYLRVVDHIRRSVSIQREFWQYRSESVNASGTMLYRLLGEDEAMDPNTMQAEFSEFFRHGVTLQYQSKLKFTLEVIPPRLDCLPTEDGIIHVTCTVPGTILLTHEALHNTITTGGSIITGPTLTLSQLINILASEIDRCPICWNYTEGGAICRVCKNGTQLPRNDKCIWLNTIGSPCNKMDAMTPAWMRPIDDKNEYCDPAKWYNDKSFCHLCTTGTTGPVVISLCAAEGCSVRFHPICAIIASASNEVQFRHGADAGRRESNGSHHKSVNNHRSYENDDAYLCTQYTQTLMETSFTTAHNSVAAVHGRYKKNAIRLNGSHSTKLHDTVSRMATTTGTTIPTTSRRDEVGILLPIMFCPYHNPKRCHEYYGLYPQGCNFNHGTIRIPHQRDYATTDSVQDAVVL